MCQPSVKIFGERNTSTNALKKIIEINSDSLVLPGASADEIEPFTKYKIIAFNLATRPLKSAIPNWRTRYRESFEDAVFCRSPDKMSWKHSATRFKDIQSFKGCHIIFCIRNPYSWVRSLFRNPYHIITQKPSDFSNFIEMDWELVGRDNLPYRTLKPHQLYEEKLRSYLSFSHSLSQHNITYQFVKFEDIILNQSKVFSEMSRYLKAPKSNFSPLLGSTKDPQKTLSYYRGYYGEEQWKVGIEDEIEVLSRRIDRKMFEKVGYCV